MAEDLLPGPAVVVIGLIQIVLAAVRPAALRGYPGSPPARRWFGFVFGSLIVAAGIALTVIE
ncbi:MAG TPA: hypothetical protein VK992_02175 [Candidatus Caenarcaniphilales bacterium]|nr:hypothetical protein [Candidatus Caenarcaniphilales bacterium]